MALELQLTTQQAVQQLTAARDAITQFQNAVNGLSRASQQVDAFARALNAIKPVSAGVAASIERVAAAANSLGGATSNVQRFTSAIQGINTGAAPQAAQNIQNIATAAERMGAATEGPERVRQSVSGIAQAASTAQAPIRNFSDVLNNLRPPTNIAEPIQHAGQAAGEARTQFQGLGTAVGESGRYTEQFASNIEKARASTGGFGNAVGNMKQVLAGFGAALTIEGLIRFIQGTTEAAQKVQAFVLRLDEVSKKAGTGAAAFQHLAETADKFGIPLDKSVEAFGRFGSVMVTTGHTIEQAESVFDNFSQALRGFGADGVQVGRVFYALSQVFEKGTVQSEELKRQMGNVFPAFEQLATAMGKSTTELAKMLKAGTVGADEMTKLGETMKKTFGGAALEAANTGVGAMQRFSNAVFLLKVNIGAITLESFKNTLNELANIINRLNFSGAIDGVVRFADTLGSYLLKGIGVVIQGFTNFFQIMNIVFSALGSFAQAIANVAQQFNVFGGLINFVGSDMGATVSILATVGAGMVTLGGAVKLAGGAYNFLYDAARVTMDVMRSGVSAFVNITTEITRQGGIIRAASNLWNGLFSILSGGAIRFIVIGVAAFTAGLAISAFFQSISNGKSFGENFNNSLNTYAGLLTRVSSRMIGAASNAAQLAGKFTVLGKDADQAAEGTKVMDGATEKIVNGLSAVDKVTQHVVDGSLKTYINETVNAGKVTEGAAKWVTTYSEEVRSSATSWDLVNQGIHFTMESFQKLGGIIQPVVDAVVNGVQRMAKSLTDGFMAAINSVVGAFRGMGSAISGAFDGLRNMLDGWGGWLRSWVNTILDWVQRAIDAIKRLMGMKAAAGGGGSDTAAAPTSYYGGVSGQPGAGGTVTVDKSVFAGARHFATGGVTGGGDGSGIPSILHPGEAVIPLVGGSVPVTFSGNIGNAQPGSGSDFKQQMYDLGIETKQEIVKTNQLLTDILSYAQGELSKIETGLGSIANGLQAAIASVVAAIGSGGGGGGSSSGGGGFSSGGVGTGSNGEALSAGDAFKQLQGQLKDVGYNEGEMKAAAAINQIANANWLLGFSGVAAGNVGYLQGQLDDAHNARVGQDSLANQALIDAYVKQYGYDAYQKLSGGGGPLNFGSRAPAYADGTPNTSGGGMHAIVHPDEAVIPLPDGRTVPVSLPPGMSEYMQSVQQMVAKANTQQSRAGASGNINLTMNIHTPDATSFRKSQQQIVSDMRSQLNRAKDVGATSKRTTEDPTKTARDWRF